MKNITAWKNFSGSRGSTERAATPSYMSSCTVSQSSSVPTVWADYIIRSNYKTTPPADYTLKDICPDISLSATGLPAELAMRKYVSDVLRVDVEKKALKLNPIVHTIPTAQKKEPGGSIILAEAEATIFILELLSHTKKNKTSDNTAASTLKLAMHLCQMLASLRNRSVCVNELSGFYFPCGVVKQCVIEVRIQWDDWQMHFVETDRFLPLSDINSRIKAVYDKNLKHWSSSSVGPFNNEVFSYPMDPTFVRDNFNGGYQIFSGQSIVIMSEKEGRVFKQPMNPSESLRLMRLRRLKSLQIGFPREESKEIRDVMMHVFDLFSPPMTDAEIQQLGSWYVAQLFAIINTLHNDFGIAHLDIRRDNVCRDQDNNCLVLIDLDRSKNMTLSACTYSHVYPNSDNYVVGSDDWKCEQLDWKQLGILFSSLFGHERHEFILKLKEGEMH